jgi:hypothetical protein
MLDRNSAKPLWEQLETILREQIDGSAFNPGDMIGSENELSKEYSISRMTVLVKELLSLNLRFPLIPWLIKGYVGNLKKRV